MKNYSYLNIYNNTIHLVMGSLWSYWSTEDDSRLIISRSSSVSLFRRALLIPLVSFIVEKVVSFLTEVGERALTSEIKARMLGKSSPQVACRSSHSKVLLLSFEENPFIIWIRIWIWKKSLLYNPQSFIYQSLFLKVPVITYLL